MTAEPGTAGEALGTDGEFRTGLHGFVPRRSQQAMATAVERVLAEKATLLVEAGTGTGKTFAYLVPAIQSGLRVAISTGTRNLQDQLFHRDLPRVREILASPVRVALLKGRSNYLCLHRLGRALQDPHQTRNSKTLKTLVDLRRWSRESAAGELADHGEHPAALAAAVTSTADNCLGAKCPDFEKCFVVKARRAAQAADVVVVNHHLLLSDFRLREEGFGVLPGVQAVIVDEAHQLPELAPQFFGERVSTRQLLDLARDVATECTTLGDIPDVPPLAQALIAAVEALSQAFSVIEGRVSWDAFTQHFATRDDVRDRHTILYSALTDLHQALEPLAPRGPELAHLSQRASQFARACMQLTGDSIPEGWVRWVERASGGGRGGSWHGAPVETADAFSRLFTAYPGSWVFTSATLSGDAKFNDFRTALGLPDAQALRLDSPFDFARQARLYLPGDLPQPGEPDYPQAVAQRIRPVLQVAGGGALVLCTSHRAVRLIAAELRQKGENDARPPWAIFVQGEGPKAILVKRFAEDGNAVLVATSSFWEGVDVKGQALRIVVIDKLPFQAKGDPVFEARLAALRKAGRRPFVDYQLPHMIVSLRQGVGRLIRDESDSGLVILCDPRVKTRGYGARVLASLPPMPEVEDDVAACTWLKAHAHGSAQQETRQ